MTDITVKNDYDQPFSATAFAKHGEDMYYAVGLAEPGMVQISRQLQEDDGEFRMLNSYTFYEHDTDASVNGFFSDRSLPDGGLIDEVKRLARHLFTTSPALEILLDIAPAE